MKEAKINIKDRLKVKWTTIKTRRDSKNSNPSRLPRDKLQKILLSKKMKSQFLEKLQSKVKDPIPRKIVPVANQEANLEAIPNTRMKDRDPKNEMLFLVKKDNSPNSNRDPNHPRVKQKVRSKWTTLSSLENCLRLKAFKTSPQTQSMTCAQNKSTMNVLKLFNKTIEMHSIPSSGLILAGHSVFSKLIEELASLTMHWLLKGSKEVHKELKEKMMMIQRTVEDLLKLW